MEHENLNMGNPIFKKKAIADFFRLYQTKEFIQALMEEENLDGEKSAYVKSRGKNGGTNGITLNSVGQN